jgi:hypothetical protein
MDRYMINCHVNLRTVISAGLITNRICCEQYGPEKNQLGKHEKFSGKFQKIGSTREQSIYAINRFVFICLVKGTFLRDKCVKRVMYYREIFPLRSAPILIYAPFPMGPSQNMLENF